jgi:hypothetical protein
MITYDFELKRNSGGHYYYSTEIVQLVHRYANENNMTFEKALQDIQYEWEEFHCNCCAKPLTEYGKHSYDSSMYCSSCAKKLGYTNDYLWTLVCRFSLYYLIAYLP